MASSNETSLKLKLEKLTLDTDQGILDSEEKRWGLPLKDLYKHAQSFYKEKEGKALHLSYEDKLKLVAFTQQASHGAFDEKTAPPLGVFDVIGRDRRAAWSHLGNISQVQAIVGFIHLLDRLCPLFKTYVEAIHKDAEEKKLQKKKEEVEQEKRQELQKRAELERARQISAKPTEEEQQNRIKDALNAQTYEQFLEYAQQQFPGNVDQQAILIRQLQDQHYQQYIQQLAVQHRLSEATPNENNQQISPVRQDEHKKEDPIKGNEINETKSDTAPIISPKKLCNKTVEAANEITEYPDESLSEDGDGFPHIEEASMWTRGGDEVAAFKAGVLAAGGRGQLHVAHGETLTVRVPTHEGGRCLFWEFATDNYDIGFGVYFEWSKSPTNQVTVQTSDSEEDEGDENDFDDEEAVSGDLEAGSTTAASRPTALQMLKAPLSAVVEIFRRDSHLEVYAGSHTYPGEGVYLLKFDNTYSLWRSKTLYYRVYYTR